MNKPLNRLISVAPMMDWTDRHDRYFLRLISPHALLYTEMLTAKAIIHGDRDKLLGFDAREHPVALQLGGADPHELAEAAKIGASYGYDEINLNCGCPSDRVQNAQMGACLMAEPARVADCIRAMCDAVDVPVTIKTRIGIDKQDDYGFLTDFVGTNRDAGCEIFIIHARKAWLQGLSPKENREVPPLQYETVYQLKKDFPDLTIILNGGITTVESINEHLKYVDGVMIGREAYQNPYFLTDIERHLFNNEAIPSRHHVVRDLLPYVRAQIQSGIFLGHISRHILGLFQGLPGARAWRRHISENSHKSGADEAIIERALSYVEE